MEARVIAGLLVVGLASPRAAAQTPAPAPAEPTKAPGEAARVAQRGPEVPEAKSEWAFDFHGYVRAPLRVGIGKRKNPGPDESGTTLHRPLVPDDRYLNWQSTPHSRSDWGELFFAVGNAWAQATVALQSYNFTEATWGDNETQLGISQGYVTLFSDLDYDNVRLRWRVGAFTDKYGSAGRYDAGQYETYLFGRTHQMGETLRVELDLNPSWTLWGEHGIGTKRPDPSPQNNARFTMLHHVHAGLQSGRELEFSAHYLHSWAQEEPRENPDTTATGTSIVDIGDGKMWVAGVDARLTLGRAGYLYAGYSRIGAKNATIVSGAIEVLHAYGGGEGGIGVVENYFGPSRYFVPVMDPMVPIDPMDPLGRRYPPACMQRNAGDTSTCSMGTGSVDSVLAQYELSFADLLRPNGVADTAEGPDLELALYGMVNKVTSDYAPAGPASVTGPTDDTLKLKYGVDLAYRALPWLTPALRFDRVQPNSELPSRSFAIFSPRLVFTTNWLSHEQITLQYSRYMYSERTCEDGAPAACVQPPPSGARPDGFGSFSDDTGERAAPAAGTPARPDLNVFKVEATFWW